MAVGSCSLGRVNVNTTDATTGATALLLPAQNTHTLHDRVNVNTTHATTVLRLCNCPLRIENTHTLRVERNSFAPLNARDCSL
jgi:hypothetical protein